MRHLHRSLLFGTASLILAAATSVQASHLCRGHLLREYETNRRYLNIEHRQRRNELKTEFERERECILADIREASATLHGCRRAEVLKDLHCRLRDATRSYHRRLHAIQCKLTDQRLALQRELNFALRSCLASCSSVCQFEPAPSHEHARPHFGHSPNERHDLPPVPQAPIEESYRAPVVPNRHSVPYGGFVPEERFTQRATPLESHDRYSSRRPISRPEPRGFDWQRMVFELLASRFNR